MANSVIPLASSFGEVFAAQMMRSAEVPLVMKIFDPLITQCEPSRTAVV